MGPETQSEDRKEYRATELDKIITQSEIWFDEVVRPKIKEDVKLQMQESMAPFAEKIGNLNTRLLIKSIAFVLLIVIDALLTISIVVAR